MWKTNIMPKIKHFLWRIMSKAIGNSTRLNSRGMNLDPICPRCGLEEETIDHSFFTCPDSISGCKLSNLPYISQLTTVGSMDEIILFLKQLYNEQSLSLHQRIYPFGYYGEFGKREINLYFRKIFYQLILRSIMRGLMFRNGSQMCFSILQKGFLQ